MSCYFRHIADLFEEAGVEVTKANRKAIHARIASIVGDAEERCPTTWKLVKEWRDEAERKAKLVAGIRKFGG